MGGAVCSCRQTASPNSFGGSSSSSNGGGMWMRSKDEMNSSPTSTTKSSSGNNNNNNDDGQQDVVTVRAAFEPIEFPPTAPSVAGSVQSSSPASPKHVSSPLRRLKHVPSFAESVRTYSDDDEAMESVLSSRNNSMVDIHRLVAEGSGAALNEVGRALMRYVPHRVWAHSAGDSDSLSPPSTFTGVQSKEWTGALLFVDVSGFTALSEYFAARGSRGIEMFSEAMSNLFRCGLELNQRFCPYEATEECQIHLHSAVGVGKNISVDVGGGICGQRAAFVIGEAIEQIRVAHPQSKSGELVASKEAYEMARRYITSCRPVAEGCVIVSKMVKLLPNMPVSLSPPLHSIASTRAMARICRKYLPNVVVERISAGQESYLGELRRVTVAFVNLNIAKLNDVNLCLARNNSSSRKSKGDRFVPIVVTPTVEPTGGESSKIITASSPTTEEVTLDSSPPLHPHSATTTTGKFKAIQPQQTEILNNNGTTVDIDNSTSNSNTPIGLETNVVVENNNKNGEEQESDNANNNQTTNAPTPIEGNGNNSNSSSPKRNVHFGSTTDFNNKSPNNDDTSAANALTKVSGRNLFRQRRNSNNPVNAENDGEDESVLDLIQKAVVSSFDAVTVLDGFIRQVTNDDKGMVLIYAFGVPGCSHDNDALRAVRVAMDISTRLSRLNVRSSIGLATGEVYCGCVGSTELRCDYALVGNTVNKAARLAANAGKYGVASFICSETEQAVRACQGDPTGAGVTLTPHEPIQIKGSATPVSVFIPEMKAASARGWRVIRNFMTQPPRTSGDAPTFRMDELLELSKVLKGWDEEDLGGLLLIQADAGNGKDALLDALVKRRDCGTAHIIFGKEDNASRPLSVLRIVIKQLVMSIVARTVMSNTSTAASSSNNNNGGVTPLTIPPTPVIGGLKSPASGLPPMHPGSLISPTGAASPPPLSAGGGVLSSPSMFRSNAATLLSLRSGESGKIMSMHLRRVLNMRELDEIQSLFGELDDTGTFKMFHETETKLKQAASEYAMRMSNVEDENEKQQIKDARKKRVRGGAGGTERRDRLLLKLVSGLVSIAQDFEKRAGSRVALIMYDIHDMDEASIRIVLGAMRNNPAMRIVASCRKGGCKFLSLLVKAHPSRLVVLRPLRRDEMEMLAKHTLKATSVPVEVIDYLESNTEGNVLFCLEVLRVLLASGVLSVSEDGSCVLLKSLASTSLPKSINGFITTRLDFLQPQLTMVLKVASVIGMTFSASLLHRLFPVEQPLSLISSSLTQLVTKQFLIDAGDDRFSFSSSALRQVVYSTLLHSYRQQLHKAYAILLETDAETKSTDVSAAIGGIPAAMSEMSGELQEILAFHWSEAVPEGETLNAADLMSVDRAATYTFLVGTKASRNLLFNSATNSLQQSLAFLLRLPSSPERNVKELLTLTELCRSAQLLFGFSDPLVKQYLTRALTLIEFFFPSSTQGSPFPSPLPGHHSGASSAGNGNNSNHINGSSTPNAISPPASPSLPSLSLQNLPLYLEQKLSSLNNNTANAINSRPASPSIGNGTGIGAASFFSSTGLKDIFSPTGTDSITQGGANGILGGIHNINSVHGSNTATATTNGNTNNINTATNPNSNSVSPLHFLDVNSRQQITATAFISSSPARLRSLSKGSADDNMGSSAGIPSPRLPKLKLRPMPPVRPTAALIQSTAHILLAYCHYLVNENDYLTAQAVFSRLDVLANTGYLRLEIAAVEGRILRGLGSYKQVIHITFPLLKIASTPSSMSDPLSDFGSTFFEGGVGTISQLHELFCVSSVLVGDVLSAVWDVTRGWEDFRSWQNVCRLLTALHLIAVGGGVTFCLETIIDIHGAGASSGGAGSGGGGLSSNSGSGGGFGSGGGGAFSSVSPRGAMGIDAAFQSFDSTSLMKTFSSTVSTPVGGSSAAVGSLVVDNEEPALLTRTRQFVESFIAIWDECQNFGGNGGLWGGGIASLPNDLLHSDAIMTPSGTTGGGNGSLFGVREEEDPTSFDSSASTSEEKTKLCELIRKKLDTMCEVAMQGPQPVFFAAIVRLSLKLGDLERAERILNEWNKYRPNEAERDEKEYLASERVRMAALLLKQKLDKLVTTNDSSSTTITAGASSSSAPSNESGNPIMKSIGHLDMSTVINQLFRATEIARAQDASLLELCALMDVIPLLPSIDRLSSTLHLERCIADIDKMAQSANSKYGIGSGGGSNGGGGAEMMMMMTMGGGGYSLDEILPFFWEARDLLRSGMHRDRMGDVDEGDENEVDHY